LTRNINGNIVALHENELYDKAGLYLAPYTTVWRYFAPVRHGISLM